LKSPTNKVDIAVRKTHPFAQFLVSPLEVELPTGKLTFVPRCSYRFKAWHGKPIENTYGGKTVLDVFDRPVFAELGILRILQNGGWDGVWVDTYRRQFRQDFSPHQCKLPTHARKLYDRIRLANTGKTSGCFDVFAWRRGQYLFVESKRDRKDRIRESQMAWIEAALSSGVPLKSLLICEWAVC